MGTCDARCPGNQNNMLVIHVHNSMYRENVVCATPTVRSVEHKYSVHICVCVFLYTCILCIYYRGQGTITIWVENKITTLAVC